jgi:hypothetical protein
MPVPAPPRPGADEFHVLQAFHMVDERLDLLLLAGRLLLRLCRRKCRLQDE